MITVPRIFMLTLALTAGLVLWGCRKADTPGAPAAAEVGKPAPGFTLKDVSGKPWSLEGHKGSLVFINFWATWCPPCVAEMPSMERLNRELAAESFRMVTILYQDDPAAAAAFARERGYTFPILIDPGDQVAKAYGLTGVPETFIVDPKGVLRNKFIGAQEWNMNPLKANMRRMLPPGT